jgi:replicative DNA helicase
MSTIPNHLFNLDAEFSLLGSLIMGKRTDILDQLKEEYFYCEQPKKAYKLIKEGYKNYENLDLISLYSSNNEEEKTLLLETVSRASLTSTPENLLVMLAEFNLARQAFKLGKNITEISKSHWETGNYPKLLEVEMENYNQVLAESETKSYKAFDLLNGWLENKANALSSGLDTYKLPFIGLGKETSENTIFVKQGHLVSVVARTKSGKTTFLSQIALDLLKKNIPVLFVTLEIKPDELMDKIIAYKANVNPLAVQNFGKEGQSEFNQQAILKTMGELENQPLQMQHNANCSINQIVNWVKQFKKEHPSGAVLIDQLQFISSGQKFESRIYEYDFIIKKLKQLALETSTMVFVAHQLNRDIERRNEPRPFPITSDIKDCGRIEEVSDLLIMFARNNEKDDETRYTTIISRHQQGGQSYLKWDKTKGKFETYA